MPRQTLRSNRHVWSLLLFSAAIAAWLLGSNQFVRGQSSAKLPIPSESDQTAALKSIVFAHKNAYEEAKESSQARLNLADQLLKQAEKESKSESKYVLLRESWQWAARGGDYTAASWAIEELERQFLVEGAALRAQALERATEAAATPEAQSELVNAALNQITEAMSRDDYKIATQLGRIAEAAARKTKDLPLVLSVIHEQKGIQSAKQSYAKIKPFADRLKDDPADAEANLQVGKYLCFHKGDWEQGLFYLAQCDDEKLRLFAQRDLIGPDAPKEQVQVGHTWWDLAEQFNDQVRTHMQQRAVYWYQQAVYSMEGPSQEKLEARIAAVPAPRRAGVPWDYSGPPGAVSQVGRHFGSIYGVAFSPNGQIAASGGSDNRVELWDVKTGKKLRTLTGHNSTVWGVEFGPKGKHLFTSSWDGTAMMWEVNSGKLVKRFPNVGRFGSFYGLAVSPDGRQLLTGVSDGTIRHWDVKTGKSLNIFRGHKGSVYGVTFSRDGKTALSSGSFDRQLIHWDVKTGKVLRTIPNVGTSIRYVAISPDGTKAVAAGEAQIRLWNLKTGKEIHRFKGHTGVVYAVAISPDGRRLISGGSDRSIRYWDLNTGKLLYTFNGHTSTVYSLAFSPGGGRVVSGSIDNTIRLWGMPR